MSRILLKNACLLDHNHNMVPGDILVDGRYISQVAPNLPAELADETIDLTGYTVMPGLFNNHLHLVDPSGDPEKSFSESDMRSFAMSGVTAVRDMGIDQAFYTYADYVAWKEKMEAAPEHPELFTYGYFQRVAPMKFGPPPSMDGDDEKKPAEDQKPKGPMKPMPFHATVEECIAAVEEAHQYGCCGIKLHGFMTRGPEEIRKLKAMVETAAKYSMPVAAHINVTAECEGLMDCGAKEAAHIATDLTPPEVVERMAAYGFVVTPTVANYSRMDRDGFFPNGEFQNCVMKNIENYHKAGIKMTVGTDYMGTPEAPYVVNEVPVLELKLMCQCGMSIQDVIDAATINSAETCGAADRMGTLEAGKLANIIAVRAPVTEDFSALEHVNFVMNRGTVIKHQ